MRVDVYILYVHMHMYIQLYNHGSVCSTLSDYLR